MLNIRIIALGKLKERYWTQAETEYLKRLTPYAKIELIELSEESFKEGADKEKIKEKEAQKIKKIIRGDEIIVALHETGKEMNSPAFAQFLEDNSSRGETITFLIGGPLGLHPSILHLASMQISLSKLTFPHQMVRTILLEQIYRGITIQKGKQYHY